MDSPRWTHRDRWDMMLHLSSVITRINRIDLPEDADTAVRYTLYTHISHGASSNDDQMYAAHVLVGDEGFVRMDAGRVRLQDPEGLSRAWRAAYRQDIIAERGSAASPSKLSGSIRIDHAGCARRAEEPSMDWSIVFSLVRRVRILVIVAIVLGTTKRMPAAQVDVRQSSDANVARGVGYVLSPAPNYPHCTDPGDAAQLTDGQLTEGHFWTQKSTVGWSGQPYAVVTIDLGKSEPISGASFRTAAGVAGVLWPVMIRVQVSDDGKQYRDIGDLIKLDESGEQLPQGYGLHRYVTSKLKGHGRYVRFVVLANGPYLFADEVEVFRGPAVWLQADMVGEPAQEPEDLYRRYRVDSRIAARYRLDADGIAQAIQHAALPEATSKELLSRLSDTRDRLMESAGVPAPASFRTVLPYSELHAELFRIQAALWRASKAGSLSAWAACGWDPGDAFAPIPADTGSTIEVHTMLNEYRSAAFNLANATDKPMRVSIRFAGIPGAPQPDYLTVHEVLWTDTYKAKLVTSALPPADRDEKGWSVRVPPGLIRQVWLTFHVTGLLAGEYQGSIVMNTEGVAPVTVPLKLNIYPLTFPKQTTLWLGGWDYTDGKGARGITPENRDLVIRHLQEHFVNAPWATRQVLTSFKFSDDQSAKVELDTRRFDEWVSQWPDARAYLVFLAVNESFAGTRMGTDAFRQRVGLWMSAWVRHLATRGIRPDQLGLLLVDEPTRRSQAEVIIAWAKAIRAAEPKVLIWEDPLFKDMQAAPPELFEVCDILCPMRPRWLAHRKPYEDFFLKQQRQGRTLQFYSCSGPAPLLDPYSYYRLQAWHCWQVAATGSFFWSFGDNGVTTSWNAYLGNTTLFTPQFLDERSVTPAKPMEAIRESVEDYEYFAMLRKAVDRASAAGKTGPAADKARNLLKEAADTVLGAEKASDLTWHVAKDRTKADRVRVELLKALVDLNTSN